MSKLDRAQWEALCDGCGKCCLHKLEDDETGEMYATNVACRLLDRRTAQCSNYRNRRAYVSECVRLTNGNVDQIDWLPSTCAYRLRAAGEPLPEWHYLVSGDRDAVPPRGRVGARMDDQRGRRGRPGEPHGRSPALTRVESDEAIIVVRHPRARRARLSFDPVTARVRLTIPSRAALAPMLAWAQSKEAWIAEQRQAVPQPRPFVAGATLPFDGDDLAIVWCADAPRRVERNGAQLIVGGPIERTEARVAAWVKQQALALLSADTAFYAERAGVSVARVSVADPRGRWGSCASSGAIRYSWRLALAPREVRRATAAHEVAHRVHMNHGADFHALVGRPVWT